MYSGNDAYMEFDGSTNEIAYFVFNNRIDEPLVRVEGTTEYTYHQNHLGSVTAMSDDDEDMVNGYRSESYGGSRTKLEGIKQPYSYTGREHVGNSGLFYYRSRVYSSGSGRFVREDDLQDGFNWYVYAQGRPTYFVDPFGTDNESGGPFLTVEKAFEDIALLFNFEENERGGFIYSSGSGFFWSRDSFDETPNSGLITFPALLESASKVVIGGWHTHPNGSGTSTPVPGDFDYIINERLWKDYYKIAQDAGESLRYYIVSGQDGHVSTGIAKTIPGKFSILNEFGFTIPNWTPLSLGPEPVPEPTPGPTEPPDPTKPPVELTEFLCSWYRTFTVTYVLDKVKSPSDEYELDYFWTTKYDSLISGTLQALQGLCLKWISDNDDNLNAFLEPYYNYTGPGYYEVALGDPTYVSVTDFLFM